MKKYLLIAICMAIICVNLITINALTIKNKISFNGEFQNGTTLYSDWYHITDSVLYGDDSYPIKENCIETQVCSRYEYNYEKTCLKYYSDICRRYDYHYERICVHYARYDSEKCLSYRRIKIIDECVSYRDDLCRIYKTKKIKGDCIQYKTKKVCDILPIGCLDPNTNIYTNQLNLRNFKMSYDNNTWIDIPYGRYQLWIDDANIIFKVDIPAVCNPRYDIDNSIQIVSHL